MATVTTTPGPQAAAIPNLASLGTKPLQLSLAIGVVGLVIGAIISVAAGATRHLAFSYLMHLCFFCSISLGGLFFVLIQYLTRAGWSVVIRRFAELASQGLMPLGLLFIPIVICVLAGTGVPFSWTDAELAASDELISMKRPYLNGPFFTFRVILYFTFWIWLARRFYTASLQQDRTGDPQITNRLEGISAPGIFFFAISVTFAAFDWLMSLDPHWFSTIFGIYYFAGCMVSFLAVVSIVVNILQQQGSLRTGLGGITVEHRHDLGKLMFGFNCFWAYIAFSQYLLIWYGNIPEETLWFKIRQEGTWVYVSVLLIVGHFVLPFMGFLSRHAKRNANVQTFWACWLLAMHWFDLYWLAMPQLDTAGPPLGLIDLSMLIGLGGLWVGSLLYIAGDRPLIPQRDPRLPESLNFHNM